VYKRQPGHYKINDIAIACTTEPEI
jgi:hypothetical protein